MATLHHPGADLAPRHAARNAAPLKDEDPGLAGVGVFKSVKQNSRLAPLGHHCERPAMAGQQVALAAAAGPMPVSPSAAVMTSREIAELTGKEHRNVLADIRAMLDALGHDVLSFQQMLPDAYGRMQPAFALPKDMTLTLVAGYSVPVRHRIVVRLMELEEGATAHRPPAVPINFREALRLAADQQEVIERQAEQIAITAPKAGALDRIATATEGAACLREAAKVAQVPERQYTEFARAEGWIFKQRGSGKWMGYADKERAGLLELKRRIFTKPDGTEGSDVQVLVTPRGQAKLAELIERKAPHLRKTAADGQPAQLVLPMATTGETV